MPLTSTQRGVIGQTEAVKLVTITSDGEVEASYPAADDDHRDVETHRRKRFVSAALQVKTAWRLWVHRQSRILQIPFTLPASRLVNNPHFWYFFGYFDRKALAFADPIFLVPSTEVHKHAMPRLVNGIWRFTFQASLKPGARDRWSKYRVTSAFVGKRLLEIIRDLEKQAATTSSSRDEVKNLPGVLWVRAAL